MNKKNLFLTIFLILVLGLSLLACGDDQEEQDNGENGEQTDENGKDKEVELAYVEWDSEVASTFVVKNVLEDVMGYDVELTPVAASAMWEAVGTGDVDGMVAAWLQTTHEHYLEKVEDSVDNLGPNLEGTRIGLVVPEYVTIDSISELNENAEKFNGKIIGIDPGAGLMSKTEKVLEEYNLTNFKLIEGSGATMTAALADAIENNEWVVVTGWTPHWKFGKWDLKYLEDPKGVYGGEEWISTIVRDGLKKDMPDVYKFLDNFYWTPEDMSQVMVWNQEEGADVDANAERWINQNTDMVKEWVPEEYKDKVQ
jgi:glycine betaine/proline transport system substrate-binding protein